MEAPANSAQKAKLAKLSPSNVTASELGGEPILQILTAAPGDYTVSWFNPREGGPLSARTGGTPAAVTPSAATTGAKLTLSAPSADDWLAVVRRK
jgi:phosphoglucomutase